MAGTVSRANGTISEDASTEDIGRLINAHMTARREVAAMPNVIAADVAMPIETSDNPLAVAQVEEWMRVGREGDEEQDGYLKTVAAKRSSERLKTRGRAPTLGCSEFRDTQKISPISRSFRRRGDRRNLLRRFTGSRGACGSNRLAADPCRHPATVHS